jgi:hypothetical protein
VQYPSSLRICNGLDLRVSFNTETLLCMYLYIYKVGEVGDVLLCVGVLS